MTGFYGPENGTAGTNTNHRHGYHGDAGRGYEVLDIEIDRGCDNCGTNCLPGNVPLYKYSEIPAFLRGNPYVVDGYRAMLPFSLCLRSLFVWTNETLNVWSHLLGFVMFFWLMLWDNAVWIPSIGGGGWDHVVLSLGMLCFQFCMLCSSGYHLFGCHSEKANSRWLALDLTGISVGLLGCYLPAVHYAFYCLSIWRDIYLIVISVLFGAVLYYQTQPRYYSDGWFHRRLTLYIGLSAYGIVPTLHWVYLNGGVQAEVVQLLLPKVVVMYILGVAAFAFYISKCPERCFPGRFDYCGSSHQLWHVIVVIAFYWWHGAGQAILQYRMETPCS